MNALVFAAGLGTRLKPFTLHHPKALVEVGGVPMLQRVIERVAAAGAKRVVVNTHHFADQIVSFLNSRQWPVDVVVSDESALLLDTGGGILNARPLLDDGEPFIVHNADILTDFPLRPMVDAHRATHAIATLFAQERKSSRQLLFDADNRLKGWENLTTGEVRSPYPDFQAAACHPMAFGGVHVLSAEIFEYLEQYRRECVDGSPAFPIIPFYLDLCAKAPIRAYVPSAEYMWHDIGTPEKLQAAELHLSKHD